MAFAMYGFIALGLPGPIQFMPGKPPPLMFVGPEPGVCDWAWALPDGSLTDASPSADFAAFSAFKDLAAWSIVGSAYIMLTATKLISNSGAVIPQLQAHPAQRHP